MTVHEMLAALREDAKNRLCTCGRAHQNTGHLARCPAGKALHSLDDLGVLFRPGAR